MLSDIINYLEINPLLGTAGQPKPDQFPAIQQAGYQSVINLLPPTAQDILPGEPALVAGLGLDYINIPVIWTAPTPDNLAQFFAAMRRQAGRKTFVHCAMNMRVSAFVFLYRVLALGEDRAAAEPDLKKIWQPNPTWQAFIDEQLKAGPPPV